MSVKRPELDESIESGGIIWTNSLSTEEPPLADFVELDSTSFETDSICSTNSRETESVIGKKRTVADFGTLNRHRNKKSSSRKQIEHSGSYSSQFHFFFLYVKF